MEDSSTFILDYSRWRTDGVSISSLNDFEFPFAAREDASIGNHWIFCQQNVAITKGDQVEFKVAIRNVSAEAIRLRLDVGGVRVCNGHFTFATQLTSVKDFTHFSILRNDFGVDIIEASWEADSVVTYLIPALVFGKASEHYQYPGSNAEIVVEWAEISVRSSAVTKHYGTHCRSSDFGRAAYRLCKGKGLEIGALHRPFDLDANVIYLDRDGTSVLRHNFKNDESVGAIRQVELVWKGNEYPFIDNHAFDFVINSHVLEHVANPGRTIEEWIRIIRPGGVLYMVVPDKNYTFDRPREVTSVSHLMADYHSRIDTIPIEHYADFILNREGPEIQDSDKLIRESFKKQTSVHVHTFTAVSLRLFLETLRLSVKFDIEYFEPQAVHIHTALRKI